ncbi:MAG: hybrid sensor histidine kinase/response regulator, partial [Anaerolineae bacterium]
AALPVYRADWSQELANLRQGAFTTLGLVLALGGYVWVLIAGLAMHPGFDWRPLVTPCLLSLLGGLLFALRQKAVRRHVYLVGGLAACAAALAFGRSPEAPFLLVAMTTSAVLASESSGAFVTAGWCTAMLGTAAIAWPGTWSLGTVSAAVVLYWLTAASSWLVSRDLYTVLSWALHGYESAWNTTRELQEQRGKLNRTMKALADANLLLKRTTHDLAAAHEEAERARQLKGQFAANISHELRTPLHLIVGFTQIMYTSSESYDGAVFTSELRADIQDVYESAQHLLRLIDDVLDLSKVEAARLPISKEKVALAPLLRDTVETARSLLRTSGLPLRLTLPEQIPSVYVDPTRIRQVLLNLLNNAARFTETGHIGVSVAVHEQDVEVTVQDTGVGIPHDQLVDIFDEFHQVDASLRRPHDGTGLGLAICKQFVTMHGGRIWAESEIGSGSAFHFTLPLPESSSPIGQRPKLPAGWRYPARKPSVPTRLVTLSEPAEFSRLLHRYLPDTEVIEVAALGEVAAAARAGQADAVVVAHGSLAEEDEARLASATADLLLPVVSWSLPLEGHLAIAEGFSHCLMKPFTAEQLVRTLRDAVPAAKRILVVDDDPGVARMVQRCLRSAGMAMEVMPAYDGESAVAKLDEAPDIVLLDLILPKMNGLDVLRIIRESDGERRLPVVAITAYGFARDTASLGQGLVSIRRGQHFSAAEMARWLDSVLKAMPPRYLAPAALEPEPPPVPTG